MSGANPVTRELSATVAMCSDRGAGFTAQRVATVDDADQRDDDGHDRHDVNERCSVRNSQLDAGALLW